MCKYFLSKEFFSNTYKNFLFSLISVSIFFGAVSSLKADLVRDNISLVKKISNEQDLIANTLELYVELYGGLPNNINQLITKGLLDNSFSSFALSNFTVNANSITINSTLNDSQIYQKDFFLNDFSRDRVVEPKITGSTFSTKYYLSKEALNTLSYIDVVDYVSPTKPTSASAGNSWYDTRKKKIFYYIGGNWITLDAKKLWIVSALVELNSLIGRGASENDAGIVLTPTSFDKYLFVSSAWHKIENVPYNYNTGFNTTP